MNDKSVICAQKMRIPKPTQFGSKMTTTHQRYQMELDNNVRLLSVNFPQESSLKMKQLLQELDNDISMVQDVLQQQGHKLENQAKTKVVNGHKQLNPNEEKKMLMKAVASLYKKLKEEESQKKRLEEENGNLKRENEFYKNRSNLLSSQQFSNDFKGNLHIY